MNNFEYILAIFRSARFRRYALKVQCKRLIKGDREARGENR